MSEDRDGAYPIVVRYVICDWFSNKNSPRQISTFNPSFCQLNMFLLKIFMQTVQMGGGGNIKILDILR